MTIIAGNNKNEENNCHQSNRRTTFSDSNIHLKFVSFLDL